MRNVVYVLNVTLRYCWSLRFMSEFLLPPPKFITARKRSCGKVMFLHLSVSHSVNRGEGSPYDVTSCLAAWSNIPSGGRVSVSGSMFLAGGFLSLVSCSFFGGLPDRDPLNRDPLEKDAPGQRPPSGQRPPDRDWLMKLKSGLQW